jgi:hypothetical protein
MTDNVERLTVCVGLLAMVNALLAFVLLAGSNAVDDSAMLAALVVGGLALAGGYALGSRTERR